ncbi:MAG: YlbF family regulator [Bacteroidota bacterium]
MWEIFNTTEILKAMVGAAAGEPVSFFEGKFLSWLDPGTTDSNPDAQKLIDKVNKMQDELEQMQSLLAELTSQIDEDFNEIMNAIDESTIVDTINETTNDLLATNGAIPTIQAFQDQYINPLFIAGSTSALEAQSPVLLTSANAFTSNIALWTSINSIHDALVGGVGTDYGLINQWARLLMLYMENDPENASLTNSFNTLYNVFSQLILFQLQALVLLASGWNYLQNSTSENATASISPMTMASVSQFQVLLQEQLEEFLTAVEVMMLFLTNPVFQTFDGVTTTNSLGLSSDAAAVMQMADVVTASLLMQPGLYGRAFVTNSQAQEQNWPSFTPGPDKDFGTEVCTPVPIPENNVYLDSWFTILDPDVDRSGTSKLKISKYEDSTIQIVRYYWPFGSNNSPDRGQVIAIKGASEQPKMQTFDPATLQPCHKEKRGAILMASFVDQGRINGKSLMNWTNTKGWSTNGNSVIRIGDSTITYSGWDFPSTLAPLIGLVQLGCDANTPRCTFGNEFNLELEFNDQDVDQQIEVLVALNLLNPNVFSAECTIGAGNALYDDWDDQSSENVLINSATTLQVNGKIAKIKVPSNKNIKFYFELSGYTSGGQTEVGSVTMGVQGFRVCWPSPNVYVAVQG